MIFQYLPELFSDPLGTFALICTIVGAIIVAVTIHEFSHAFTSNILGDHTAKGMGRLTFNPISHLDPIGTLLFLTAGFGWGKPVPVNPAMIDKIAPRVGMPIISLAGPASNFISALVGALLLRNELIFSITNGQSQNILVVFVYISIALMIINLLPLPPLDGYKVALGVLPTSLGTKLAQLERLGPLPLLALLLVEFIIPGMSIISVLIGGPLRLLTSLVL